MINDYCFALSYTNVSIRMNYPTIDYFHGSTCQSSKKIEERSLQSYSQQCLRETHSTNLVNFMQPIFQPNASASSYYYTYGYSYQVEAHFNLSQYHLAAFLSKKYEVDYSINWLVDSVYNTSSCLVDETETSKELLSILNHTAVPIQIHAVAVNACFPHYDHLTASENSYLYFCDRSKREN